VASKPLTKKEKEKKEPEIISAPVSPKVPSFVRSYALDSFEESDVIAFKTIYSKAMRAEMKDFARLYFEYD
jgi:hypothetical protein